MIRESLLAFARTMTQCRETDRTHRPERRNGDAGTVGFAEVECREFGATATTGGFGATSLAMLEGDAVVSTRALSMPTVDDPEPPSANAANTRTAAVSVSNGEDADAAATFGGAFDFERLASCAAPF